MINELATRTPIEALTFNRESAHDLFLDEETDDLNRILADMTPENQMKYILEHVCAGPGRCQFIEGEPFEGTIDLTNVITNDKDRSDVLFQIRVLKDYLALPIIIDEFGTNHGDEETGRTGWRKRMKHLFGESFHAIVENHKLRINKLQGLFVAINFMLMILTDYPQLSHLTAAAEQFKKVLVQAVPDGKTWSTLDTASKQQRVETISQALMNLLTTLDQAQPTSSGSM